MVFIWRGSGIAIPIVLLINAWIVGQFYDDHRIGNLPETAWICFYTAIIVLLHGLIVFPWKNTEPTEVVINADGTQEEAYQPPASLGSHSFFYIPVIFWALIFGGISAYCFFSGSSKDEPTELSNSPAPKEEIIPQRSVYLFNPTADTMFYVISGANGYYIDTLLEPNTFTHRDLDAGTYIFAGFDTKNEALLRIPAEKNYKDPSKSKLVKVKGKDIHQRILRPATASETDYDDAWIILDGEHDMVVVDVTSICKKGLTEADVKNTNWTSLIKEKFDAQDLMEPLYGKNESGKSITVLNMSDDIPSEIAGNEKVYMLLSTDKELTNEYLAKRILIFCPTLQGT
jgi:hypothetical protein